MRKLIQTVRRWIGFKMFYGDLKPGVFIYVKHAQYLHGLIEIKQINIKDGIFEYTYWYNKYQKNNNQPPYAYLKHLHQYTVVKYAEPKFLDTPYALFWPKGVKAYKVQLKNVRDSIGRDGKFTWEYWVEWNSGRIGTWAAEDYLRPLPQTCKIWRSL